jgi:hypothetical protein
MMPKYSRGLRPLTVQEGMVFAAYSLRRRRLMTICIALVIGIALATGDDFSLSWWAIFAISVASAILLHAFAVISGVLSPVTGFVVCEACGKRRPTEVIRTLLQEEVSGDGRCVVCRHQLKE